jgi:pyruvate kinase
MFGAPRDGRQIRIMVTLPAEAATDLSLVRTLVERGMDCARINCAHDGVGAWAAMVEHVRRAARAGGRPCTVLMDLGGPKVRTGAVLTPGPGARLHPGMGILLTRVAPADPDGMPFQAQCSIPEILDVLRPSAEVWIDDGKLGARVTAIGDDGAELTVTYTGPKGACLLPDKGLNFPDTELRISPLTADDLQDLDFVARNADIVGYSFVQEPGDVALLQAELRSRLPAGAPLLPVILKIETLRAVRNLSSLIVQAAGQQQLGVMIARGDLAVEIGYQRLAEMQEEILWLCEAAHVPVVWATQVLERLVKRGMPSRAEMTDAAMAERAECVMLNKGPYIASAVSVLDDVLRRMETHQLKKTPQLRALRQWQPVEGG